MGGAVSVANIIIHALVTTAAVTVARNAAAKYNSASPSLLIAIMIPTVSVFMATHGLEVFLWALAYRMVDATAEGADRVYFAFVNYTTLGYGDVIPVDRWRLLGPITAMNGILLIGWSTAVIFEVLRRTLSRLDIGIGHET